MEPEMVSTTVNNAPAFLQLRDQYKQELVEDTRLTRAADLAAKQHLLLTSDLPDAWKRPQLKAVRRQLRLWTKKVRQSEPLRPTTMSLRRVPCKRGSRNW